MKCECYQCLRESGVMVEVIPGRKTLLADTRMVVCQVCGNKRCPHATNHRHTCTGSNVPGQPGSNYE